MLEWDLNSEFFIDVKHELQNVYLYCIKKSWNTSGDEWHELKCHFMVSLEWVLDLHKLNGHIKVGKSLIKLKLWVLRLESKEMFKWLVLKCNFKDLIVFVSKEHHLHWKNLVSGVITSSIEKCWCCCLWALRVEGLTNDELHVLQKCLSLSEALWLWVAA